MPKFEPKYTEEDFLKIIEGDSKTVGYISKKLGCARQTTLNYLNKLKDEGKVVRESIDDGNLFVWKLNKD